MNLEVEQQNSEHPICPSSDIATDITSASHVPFHGLVHSSVKVEQ